MECPHCLKKFEVKNSTNIQIIIAWSKTREDPTVGRVIDLDVSFYGFIPIEHPTISKVLDWARKANITINQYDELCRIFDMQQTIIIEEEQNAQ